MADEKYVTYIRVSTDKQGRSGLGLDAQRLAVRQFLTTRQASVVAEFVEIESGAKNDRPELAHALDACVAHKATLLIAKLDRLGRNLAFIAQLMESKTNFLAVDVPHASRLVLHVMAAFAEHECDVIRERTRAALAAAKARGVRLGINGSVLAARHRAAAGAYAEAVRDAIASAMASGAKTTREIADHLNKSGLPSRQGGRWHPASVARVTKRLRERQPSGNQKGI